MRKAVRQRYPYTDALWINPKTEADWLALRKDDVTATDAAALFGVSPYCTLFELYHRKAGTITVAFEETERMLWGKRLQPAIAEGICQDRGWKILSRAPFLYARSKRFVGLGASPDYIVLDPARGVGTLEIKNVDKFVAKDEWSEDEAPVHIEFQLQHQLEATGLPWGAVGGLIGGNETSVFIRERDDEVGLEIGNRVTDLWRRVRDSDPPQPNYLADFSTIKSLNRFASVGSVLDADMLEVGKPERLAELCAAERAATAAKKAAEEDAKAAQAEILEMVGPFERVTGIPGFKLSAITIHNEERTQVVRSNSYRRLTVTKEKARG